MARQKKGSLIKLQGTTGELTFVQSVAYDPHTRAARGTHRPAQCNEVLTENYNRTIDVNKTASPVLAQLKIVERGFAERSLWRRMLSCLFKARSVSMPHLLESLSGVELNERYRFSRLFSILPELSISSRKSTLLIELELRSHARFDSDLGATSYCCELVVLFLNGQGGCMKDSMETEWTGFEESLGRYEMKFKKPEDSHYFLAVAVARAAVHEQPIESFGARGARIVGWGKC
jgi:hypothetical protein